MTTQSKKTICVLTGTRADYGILLPILRRLSDADNLDLQLVVTGAHLSTEHGLTFRNILEDGFKIDARVEMSLASDTAVGVAKSMALGTIGFAEALERLTPDIVVVLGDRFEALAAAQAASLARIPLAHIHGGERTEGAIDEAFRHAITKMAHIHLVASDEFRRRVIQLGENPESVHTVGAPGIDSLLGVRPMSISDLEKSLAIELSPPLMLTTYHPATLEKDPLQGLESILKALDSLARGTMIFTKSNADPSGRAIGQILDGYAANRTSAHVFTSLGQQVYVNLLRHADLVLGNSSSGIIEAPAVGTPTINVGTRQKGRPQARSITNVPSDSAESILEAIITLLSDERAPEPDYFTSPYGDGKASERIVSILSRTPLEGILKKKFFDLPASLLG